MVFSPQVPDNPRRIVKLIQSVIRGWIVLKEEPRYLAVYTGLSIVLLGFSAALAYVGYQALGVQPDFTAMVYLSTLGIIMAFLNFTPDGIGLKEGIFVFSQNLVRIPEGVLVLGSLLLRGISLLTTFLIGGASYWILLKQVSSMERGHSKTTQSSDEAQR